MLAHDEHAGAREGAVCSDAAVERGVLGFRPRRARASDGARQADEIVVMAPRRCSPLRLRRCSLRYACIYLGLRRPWWLQHPNWRNRRGRTRRSRRRRREAHASGRAGGRSCALLVLIEHSPRGYAITRDVTV